MREGLESVTPATNSAADRPRTDGPTTSEMVWEVIDLVAGVGIVMLPLFILAVPGVVPLLPLAVPAIALALVGALSAVPFLLIRRVRTRIRGARHGARSARPSA